MGNESDNSTKISDLIIQHLLKKNDHKDDLEGISLFVYETDLNELSKRVLEKIRKLISEGVISEYDDTNGKKYYSLNHPND
jgi:hypothetical protein